MEGLETIGAVTRLFSFNQVVTDGLIFRVHYRVMSLLLLCFAIVSTYDLYYGRPLSCFTAKSDDFPEGVVDAACWTGGVLSYPANWSDCKIASGGDPPPSSSSSSDDEKRAKVGYYKWMGFFLFLQCFVIYLPHYAWLFFEHNCVEQLVGKLRGKARKDLQEQQQSPDGGSVPKLLLVPDVPPASTHTGRFLERYFRTDRRRQLRRYAAEYVLCETLNLVSVAVCMAASNAILGGELHAIVVEILGGGGDCSQARAAVFPRVVRCSFQGIDEEGALRRRRALCVLSESTLNEFMFAVLWVAYFLLLMADLATVAYRVLFLRSAATRQFVLARYCSCVVRDEYVEAVAQHCDVSEFFIIFLLSDNLGPGHFVRVLKEMAKIKMRQDVVAAVATSSRGGSVLSSDDEDESAIPLSSPLPDGVRSHAP